MAQGATRYTPRSLHWRFFTPKKCSGELDREREIAVHYANVATVRTAIHLEIAISAILGGAKSRLSATDRIRTFAL